MAEQPSIVTKRREELDALAYVRELHRLRTGADLPPAVVDLLEARPATVREEVIRRRGHVSRFPAAAARMTFSDRLWPCGI